MDEIKKNLAKNLTTLRKNKGLTQIELAKELNYSDKSISKWENEDAVPDIEVLKNVADFFDVTVDYLISSENNHDAKETPKKQKNKKKVHTLVTLLSCLCVWLVATVLFVSLKLGASINYWMSFVWAVPVTMIVLVVFNAIWGKHKFSITLTSILSWSLLGSIYLQVLQLNLWALFLVGVPFQIAVILWGILKR